MNPSNPSHEPRPSRSRAWLVAVPLVAALTLAGCSTATTVAAPGSTAVAEATETEVTSQVTGTTDATATADAVRAENQESHDSDDDAE